MKPADPGSTGAAETSTFHQFVGGKSGRGPGRPDSSRGARGCAAAATPTSAPASAARQNPRAACQLFHGWIVGNELWGGLRLRDT